MKKRRTRIIKNAYSIYAILIYAFFYAPVIVMAVFSFNTDVTNVSWKGLTFSWYGQLFQDGALWSIMGNTLLVGIFSTLLASVIGTMGAVGFKNNRSKWGKVIKTSIYFPIVIPEIVLAVSTFLIFNDTNVSLSIVTMILGNATLVLPYIYITVKARLVGMDSSIEEASLDLGANHFYTFLHVIFPAILPGIVSGTLMAFSLAFDDLIISSFLADPATTTLPMKIYSMLKKGVSPEINALSTIILVVFLLGMAVSILVGKRLQRKSKTESGVKDLFGSL